MYPSAGAGTSRASTAFWTIEDVVAEVAELKRRGVVFEDYDLPGIKTLGGILGDQPADGRVAAAVPLQP